MKDIFKISFLIIGTIIGAGFASGQEISLFFNIFGEIGIIGLIFSSILIGFLIYTVFNILHTVKINNYNAFVEVVNGKKGKIINIIISIFLIVSFFVMIAGMGAYFSQQFNFNIVIVILVMDFLCYIFLKKNINGIILINEIVIPFLITCILFFGFKNIPFFNIESFDYKSDLFFKCFFSSILYAGYNSLILIPILVNIGSKINTKKQYKIISIFCTFILIFLGISIFFLLENSGSYIHNVELPMLEVLKKFGINYSFLYGAVIVVAIFTSALSAGYGFLKNVSENMDKKQYEKNLLKLCLVAPIISCIGFSKLIKILYPLFGVLGALQIFAIIYNCYKLKSTKKKQNY